MTSANNTPQHRESKTDDFVTEKSQERDTSGKHLKDLEHALSTLTMSVDALRRDVDRLNSFRFAFGTSVLRGVGYALGATVVVSLVAAGLVRTVESVDFVPVVQTFFDSDFFQQLLLELNQL